MQTAGKVLAGDSQAKWHGDRVRLECEWMAMLKETNRTMDLIRRLRTTDLLIRRDTAVAQLRGLRVQRVSSAK
jgi:hypothetical protein